MGLNLSLAPIDTPLSCLTPELCTAWCVEQHLTVAFEPLYFLWVAAAVSVVYLLAFTKRQEFPIIDYTLAYMVVFMLAMILLFLWTVSK